MQKMFPSQKLTNELAKFGELFIPTPGHTGFELVLGMTKVKTAHKLIYLPLACSNQCDQMLE